MGWITLLIFPLPAFLVMYFFFDLSWIEVLQLETFQTIPIVYGLEFGIMYAFLAIIILKAPVFDRLPLKIDKMVKDLKLSYFDVFSLSMCAGIGEELLFRAGLQTFTGVWLTSFIFVAIHGYFSIKKREMNYYGLLVFPFILLISLGYEHFGLWFSISAHFAYDAVLFLEMRSESQAT